MCGSFLLKPAFCLAQAQPLDQLYSLYNSTSTPPIYKMRLARMIQIMAPGGQTHFALSPIKALTAALAPASAAGPAALGPQTTADPAFMFRDFYIFPSPARRQEKPVIRVQVGLADGVDIRIYDVSGRLVHKASFGAPQILDDGNGKGPQYTYDYAWNADGVGSGTYTCAITAHKSGHANIARLKKTALIK